MMNHNNVSVLYTNILFPIVISTLLRLSHETQRRVCSRSSRASYEGDEVAYKAGLRSMAEKIVETGVTS